MTEPAGADGWPVCMVHLESLTLPPVTFVYAFTIALVVAASCSVVWRYEPNPFVTGFLTAITYLTGLLAILSKLG
jgi:hypothetical protein